MRPVFFVMSLLLAILGTTAQGFAQVAGVVGIVGDRYESYSGQFTCTAVNCNFSFPLFVLPNNAPGTLLIEDINCISSSETTAYRAAFGPTASAGNYLGTKIAFMTINSGPYNYNANSYMAVSHATPQMLLVQNRFLTLNFYVNEKPNSTIYYSYISCSMAGRILR